jgi:hypothetical protein
MADDLIYFTWLAPSLGFKWVSTVRFFPPHTPIRVLTEIEECRRSSLWPDSALFRTFALDVEPTEQAVLGFANRHGSLGGSATSRVVLRRGEHKVQGAGESLDAWKAEIRLMRRLVELWDAAREKSLKALAAVIEWRLGGVRYVPASEWIAHPEMSPDVLAAFRPGDLIAPALHYIQVQINKKLKAHGVCAQLQSTSEGGLATLLVPESLIAALWLQFARSVEGREQRRCENCGEWFEIRGSTGTRGARSDKRFCTPSCKAAAHRKKTSGGRQQ